MPEPKNNDKQVPRESILVSTPTTVCYRCLSVGWS